MTDQEFENKIRETLKTDTTPSRDSLSHILSKLEDATVTENVEMRYTRKTTTSNIINNRITEIVNIWRSKRLVLVPSLILLLFIGAFSLSPRPADNNSSLLQLVAQDELFEEPGVDNDGDYDDQATLTGFDDQAINDLSTI